MIDSRILHAVSSPVAFTNYSQICKNKDLNAANIDDILSDMLNIDDCDLFDSNEPRQGGAHEHNDHNNDDDDFYYNRDSDDEEYEPTRRHVERVLNDEDDDNDDEDDDDDEDDEDDTVANNRRHHSHRTQLIMEAASDDNANVHSVDNMKFTNFDSAPWGSKSSGFSGQLNDFGATSFFPEEAMFQSNFPAPAVTAVFDPIDPFASSFGSNANDATSSSFGFDTSVAFGDFDSVFGSSQLDEKSQNDSAFNESFEPMEMKEAGAGKVDVQSTANPFVAVFDQHAWPDNDFAPFQSQQPIEKIDETSPVKSEQPATLKENTDTVVVAIPETAKNLITGADNNIAADTAVHNGSDATTSNVKM